MEARDVVYGHGKKCGDDEGICGDGNDVGDLDVELFVIVVEPAAGNNAGVDTIKTDYIVCGKESIEDESNDTGHAVLSQHIHRVIDADPELNLGAVIAHDASDDTKDDRCPGRNESRGGCSSYKTGDTA